MTDLEFQRRRALAKLETTKALQERNAVRRVVRRLFDAETSPLVECDGCGSRLNRKLLKERLISDQLPRCPLCHVFLVRSEALIAAQRAYEAAWAEEMSIKPEQSDG